jgi:hypothetical protein
MVVLDLLINFIVQWQTMSLGLWTMVMVDMTVDSLKDPDLKRQLCCFPIQIKSKYYPYIFLIIFGLLFPMGFLGLLAGYITGLLYSYGKLGFIEPGQNCTNRTNNYIFKHFAQNPAYISQEAAIQNDSPGFSVFQPNFPAPGQANGGNNGPNSTTAQPSQPVVPFSGTGVRLNSDLTGYQGSSNATYSSQQNVREAPKGPNPLTQKSKLVIEHNTKNPKPEESKDEDDLEGKGDVNSQNSKNDDDELLDLS